MDYLKLVKMTTASLLNVTKTLGKGVNPGGELKVPHKDGSDTQTVWKSGSMMNASTLIASCHPVYLLRAISCV